MNAPPKVLIVDDEPDIRRGVECWLRGAGFETLAAATGREGIECATTANPDAILLDVLMPGMDGMATLSRLRSQPCTQSIPVVMLSASLRDEERALDAGARFFVHKPYEGRRLVSTVKATLESFPSGSTPTTAP